MPNHVVLATGAVVVVGVAVATAVAIYESPEVRQYADDVRRRIAIALHSIGNNIDPADRAPLFNRPEDADGFLESRRGPGAEAGVDADEETRRRQREELLYWNSVHFEKQQREKKELEVSEGTSRPALTQGSPRGSSFEDFLSPDKTSDEPGTFVFNTGADTRPSSGGLRHRSEGPRGFASVYANPFADEHQIDSHEMSEIASHTISPPRDEVSDIYSATTREDVRSVGLATPEPASTPLFDADMYVPSPESSATLDRELGPNEFMTAGQEDNDAYASIQAWAQNSSQDFYSPLPVTPSVAASEPEMISDGQLTPTDSISLVGSAEDVANDLQSRDGEASRYYDVMSESSGMMTPASWSEVGSVISESDAAVPLRS